MLIENTGTPGAITRQPLLSEDEASQFRALRAALPTGWVAELQPEAGMAWLAFVYQADAPRSRPMFSVCRWDDGVGLFTQWMDGSACMAMAFTELWPVLEQILDDTLACTQPHREAVPAPTGMHVSSDPFPKDSTANRIFLYKS
jgi:hypothetical protein